MIHSYVPVCRSIWNISGGNALGFGMNSSSRMNSGRIYSPFKIRNFLPLSVSS